MPDLKKLQSLYEEGVNLIDYLKQEVGVDYNRQDLIELSYDIMAGSYSQRMQDNDYAAEKDAYGAFIAETILVGNGTLAYEGDNFHVLMGVCAKACASLYSVIIDDPQGAKAHSILIVVLSKAEVVTGI